MKTKKLFIDSGATPLCVMHYKDADRLHIHPAEKIIVKSKDKSIVLKVDIQHKGNKIVKEGEIGVGEYFFKKMGIKPGEKVDIYHINNRLESFDAIHKKYEQNKSYTQEDLNNIIKDLVNGYMSEAQITFFITTNSLRKLNLKETVYLTKAMAYSGNFIKSTDYKNLHGSIVCDKHCIGGVPGNRTTPIVVSILVASGYTVANTFTRSITSPSGTADTLETYLNVALDTKSMINTVNKVGGCLVWGGGIDVNPADDLIIRIENPLNIDSEEQIVASILSKKLATGVNNLLLDIPYGMMAKVSDIKSAKKLGKKFEYVANKLGIKIKVVYTDGSFPIGYGIGPVLEMMDVLDILQCKKNANIKLKEKSIYLASELLSLVNKKPLEKNLLHAREILNSKKALDAFNKIRNTQGKVDNLILGKYFVDIKAHKSGKITLIKNKFINQICKISGAPLHHGAGIYLYKNIGDNVKKGENIYRIYAETEHRLQQAYELSMKIKDEYVIK